MNYILKNGVIIDGNRSKSFKGSIITKGNKIDKVIEGNNLSDIKDMDSYRVIDVNGDIISPGFIDIHSHSDICYLLDEEPDSKIYQGITTEIVGNCGISSIPIKKGTEEDMTMYFNSSLQVPIDRKLSASNIIEYRKEHSGKLPVNLGVFIGHGTLRGAVVGFDSRPARKDELDEMCRLLDGELKNGVLGMTLGLIYPPGNFAPLEELIALARVVKENDGILAVHMRNESDRVFEAVDEMLHIAKETDVHLHISHLKLIGKEQWGKSDLLLEKIAAARAEGLNISCDQYPYDATSTSLAALLPNWAHDGGIEKAIERLKPTDSKLDSAINGEMQRRGGGGRVTIADTKGMYKDIEGMNIKEVAENNDISEVEAVKMVLVKTKGTASAIYHSLDEKDVLNIMKEDYISVGSDGYALSTDPSITKSNPHPRSFGSFAKYMENVRDNNLISIEDMVYKMTKLNTEILNIKNRGILKENYFADITIFNLDEIKDNCTYLNSVAKPSGIKYVMVNGEMIVNDKLKTDKKPGIVI